MLSASAGEEPKPANLRMFLKSKAMSYSKITENTRFKIISTDVIYKLIILIGIFTLFLLLISCVTFNIYITDFSLGVLFTYYLNLIIKFRKKINA